MNSILFDVERTLEGTGRGSIAFLPATYLLGVLTSLTPCTLSMFPLTVNFFESRSGILSYLQFSAGLGLTFALIGVGVGALGSTGTNQEIKLVAAGILQVYLGMTVLGLADLPALPRLGNLPTAESLTTGEDEEAGGAAMFAPLLLGAVTGLTTTPCSTPVLTSILATSLTTSIPETLLTLLTYTTGYTTLLLIATVKGKEWAVKIKGGKVVDQVLGAIIVAAGVRGILEGAIGDPGLVGMEWVSNGFQFS
ncbi:hypothetical protein TrVE_jg13076 [Triparma verrucosa]|nr:hypothetical protein TrVE_jg13076 [Triparma verrucosa]